MPGLSQILVFFHCPLLTAFQKFGTRPYDQYGSSTPEKFFSLGKPKYRLEIAILAKIRIVMNLFAIFIWLEVSLIIKTEFILGTIIQY